jgi:hypothetical protein
LQTSGRSLRSSGAMRLGLPPPSPTMRESRWAITHLGGADANELWRAGPDAKRRRARLPKQNQDDTVQRTSVIQSGATVPRLLGWLIRLDKNILLAGWIIVAEGGLAHGLEATFPL